MNKTQQQFIHVERQLSGLRINKPAGWESYLPYLEAAHDDVLGKLTDEELTEVRVSQNHVMTAEEQKVAREREYKEMAMNKDKPSH